MKLRFCEFLKLCSIYIINETSNPLFMKSFFSSILIQPELDIDYEELPFGKESNKSKANKVFSGERALSKKDAEFIKSNFDPDAFYDLIESIPGNVQQNLIDELMKKGIDVYSGDLTDILSNLLLRFMDAAIQGSDEIIIGNDDDSEGQVCTEILEKSFEKNSVIDQETEDEARRFCIDHESEIELLPLCQVAFNLNPMHKHVRDLYTDYNKCNLSVRKAIMIMNDIPILCFEEHWKYKYLDLFREDIKNQNLCNNIDLLYEGGKYLHKAMNSPSVSIGYEYKDAFPTVIYNHQTNRPGRLVDFIDEYIHHNYNLTLGYNGEPPLEWMINEFNMTNTSACPEWLLAIWLNLFVLSACYLIPINYKRKDPEDILFLAPETDYLETLEDLYYAALLNLHSIYS